MAGSKASDPAPGVARIQGRTLGELAERLSALEIDGVLAVVPVRVEPWAAMRARTHRRRKGSTSQRYQWALSRLEKTMKRALETPRRWRALRDLRDEARALFDADSVGAAVRLLEGVEKWEAKRPPGAGEWGSHGK